MATVIYSFFGSWFKTCVCILVKAYQQKKGTTTDKCAASAESDLFIQTVALLDAVIPQTARRCDLLDRLLLWAATIAFTTRLWANQTRT